MLPKTQIIRDMAGQLRLRGESGILNCPEQAPMVTIETNPITQEQKPKIQPIPCGTWCAKFALSGELVSAKVELHCCGRIVAGPVLDARAENTKMTVSGNE